MRTSQEKTNSNSPFYGCQLKKKPKIKKKKKTTQTIFYKIKQNNNTYMQADYK